MSQPRPTDPIGSIGWTERTGGVLTARDCLALARSDHSLWLSTPGVERVRSGPLVPRLGRETVAGYVGVRENSIEESTRGYVDVLGAMLAKAVAAFGDVPVPELLPDEIGAWAKRLPGGTPP